MPTTPVRDWGEALLSSFAAALAVFLSAIPKVVGFLVILIIGWIIASALAGAVAALLRGVRFNDLARAQAPAASFSRRACARSPRRCSPTWRSGSCG